jgi:hypothetical protein
MIMNVNCESVMMMIYYEVNREEKEGEDGVTCRQSCSSKYRLSSGFCRSTGIGKA